MVHAECLQEINIKDAQLRGVMVRTVLDISLYIPTYRKTRSIAFDLKTKSANL